MKFPRPYSLDEIAEMIGCQAKGPQGHMVTGLNEIHMVEPGDLVFVDHAKYYDKALNSAATTILINKEVDPPEGKAIIISEDPFNDFNKLSRRFQPSAMGASARGKNVDIHPSADVHQSVIIGDDVTIGAYTTIRPGVVIYSRCEIGSNVIVHANSVLGSDAFYYKKRPEGYDKLHSSGRLVIEDNVEIGGGCTIDRGVSGATVIGMGSKLDNQVHVGHDTVIGRNCLLAAQVGVAGCVRMEDNITLWGQVGVRSDITIGEGAVVMAQTGISKSLEGGKVYFGSPVAESREKLKEMAMVKRIPDILDRLKKLEEDG